MEWFDWFVAHTLELLGDIWLRNHGVSGFIYTPYVPIQFTPAALTTDDFALWKRRKPVKQINRSSFATVTLGDLGYTSNNRTVNAEGQWVARLELREALDKQIEQNVGMFPPELAQKSGTEREALLEAALIVLIDSKLVEEIPGDDKWLIRPTSLLDALARDGAGKTDGATTESPEAGGGDVSTSDCPPAQADPPPVGGADEVRLREAS
mgnify:CR=1 FL=1